jgi:hypothetical protein
MFNNHSAEILILLFFIITYFLSVLEKIADWKGAIAYIKIILKKLFLKTSSLFYWSM